MRTYTSAFRLMTLLKKKKKVLDNKSRVYGLELLYCQGYNQQQISLALLQD